MKRIISTPHQLLTSIKRGIWGWALSILVLSACSGPSVPKQFTENELRPHIYPDYADITIPVNIAPITFHIDDEAKDYVTRISVGDSEWTFGGDDVCPSERQWRDIKQKALAETEGKIDVEVFVNNDKGWQRMRPFAYTVVSDSIDPYISYRLISPSYITYEDLTLNQRCLETFDESLIYGNMINSDEENGQCLNCHHTQWYNPERLQFHVRHHLGGTIIAYDGDIRKVNLKTDSTLSAGVYPTWHPKQPWIVYSTNLTGQSFHTRDVEKIEVQDTKSNLIFYNLETNEVTPITNDSTNLDCFPFWSPDGKYIYYVSAHWERRDTVNLDFELIQHYKDVQYNLYRMAFDEKSMTFGPRQLVYDAVARNRSVTLPRISPDGRWLMFTEGQFGVFHIWHTDADLYLMDLTRIPFGDAPAPVAYKSKGAAGKSDIASAADNKHEKGADTPDAVTAATAQKKPDGITAASPRASGGKPTLKGPIVKAHEGTIRDSASIAEASKIPLPEYIRVISEINSPDVDSYHSWSSNGRWVIFSSRRVDGNFTRPFITYFRKDGTFTKPFELPQRNPQYHREFMRSFNIPEFMSGPVTVSPQEFARIIKDDASSVNLKIR
ncbi:MAG: hypothetical protein K6F94_09905 [Bacteroidaceae bacterium]|nr:hypothetical protein [Bacteroidaceae bacterium]